jgi:hypothetical protein
MVQREKELQSVLALKRVLAKKEANPLRRLIHDPLAWGKGLSWSAVVSWWVFGELTHLLL